MDLAQDAWNGSKFEGSFGPITDFAFVDYWTLRKRSLRLFKENLYAKGIIRRLIWNEIHTGLVATPMPVGSVIWSKKSEDEQEKKATDYAENFSTEFDLYASTPAVFDWGKSRISEHSRNKFALKALYAVTASLFHALTIKQVYRAGSG